MIQIIYNCHRFFIDGIKVVANVNRYTIRKL